MKYAWMAGEHAHTVRTFCRVLQVSPSGYYAWRSRQPAARARDNQRLALRIQQLHAAAHEAYGTKRLGHALRQQGETCGQHRVRRLRQQHAIQTHDRHQLECVCERRTGWCNSLAEAVKTWCELGETLLPANADSNVHYILRATRCSDSLEQAHYKYKDDCANRGGDD